MNGGQVNGKGMVVVGGGETKERVEGGDHGGDGDANDREVEG